MKGALIVGIDNYPKGAELRGAVNDAVDLASLLSSNEDGSRNFEIELQKNVLTRASLRSMIIHLFQADLHTALFYFSGHGCVNERGGFIVTPDFRSYDEGISMDEILAIVNQSRIKNKIVIIDSCHAGALGEPVIIGAAASIIAEGVVILAAARRTEVSMEVNGHGVFTRLLLGALKGGAADLAGNITPGSVYAYIDRSLGFWQHRPQFKSNVSRLISLRNVKPPIPMETVLKKITEYFKKPEEHYPLGRTYEFTNTDVAIPEHVTIFKDLQQMQSVGLVVPVGEQHMYFAAQNEKACRLTPLGEHYWQLVKEGKV